MSWEDTGTPSKLPMIKYFSQKKKSVAALFLSLLVFTTLAPGAAFAYSYFTTDVPEQYVVILDEGETIGRNPANSLVIKRGSTIVGDIGPNSTVYQPFNDTTYARALVERAQQLGVLPTTLEHHTDTSSVEEDSDTIIDTSLFPDGAGSPSGSAADMSSPTMSRATLSERLGASDSAGTQGIPPGEAVEEEPGLGDVAQEALVSLGTCSIGEILGRLISSLVSLLINQLLDIIKDIFTDLLDELLADPESTYSVATSNHRIEKSTASSAFKNTGVFHAPPTGILDWIGNISPDSIMFCIINEIINYITTSTIAWINSGFDGNPVFVQNPGALMKRIAAQEAGNFIYSTANGVQQAAQAGVHETLGVAANGAYRVTGAMRQSLTRGLVGYYNDYANMNGLNGEYIPPRSTLTDAQRANPQSWGARSQLYNPATNPWARVAFSEGPALQARMNKTQAMAYLEYQNSPYYSHKAPCPEGQVRKYDDSCEPNAVLTAVPGKQVESEINGRNLTKYMRVATANSFDAIVTALVNQLMKIAINKMFEGEQKVNGEIQGATQKAAR